VAAALDSGGRSAFARYTPVRVIDFLDGFDLEKQ